ncbi:MAG TPA: ABC transporter ATP-binding protein [Candidatus Wallbacteria bacterium]|nr:ABC transporter ATP-binding protein [Candidatus Wallbacteria bacterium]
MNQFKWIINFWRPYKFRAALIIFLTFVYGGFAICYPLIFKYIIDSLNANAATNGVIKFVLTLFAAGTLMAITYMTLQRNRLMMNLTLEKDIRNKIFDYLTRFGSNFYQKFGTGDIVTRLMDELEQLCHLSSSGIFRLLQVILTLFFTIGVLMALNVKLTLLSTLPLIMVFAFYIICDKDFFTKSRAMRDAVSAVNDAIETCFSGITVVKSYCCESYQKQYFDAVMEKRRSSELALIKLEQKMELIYGFMSQVGMFVIVFYGGIMVLNKEITLGTFVAFSNYIMVLAGPLMELGWFLMSFRKGFVTVDRLMEVEKETPQIIECDNPADADFNAAPGQTLISFSDLSFSYGDEFALKNLNFDIKRGEKAAFVGGFGSGKSSVLKLIMRFFDANDGELKVTGINIKNLKLKSVRDNIGYVPQDCYLFSDTILENISFGRAPEKRELENALAAAQLNDTITTFRRGLEEEIGIRGLSLSGGQKQRVSIARALLKSPKLLLLDDATSSLDNKTEDSFWDSVSEKYPGVTVIFASHRINTIKRADRIFLLENGRITTSGTFEELSRNSEAFKKLLQSEKTE